MINRAQLTCHAAEEAVLALVDFPKQVVVALAVIVSLHET